VRGFELRPGGAFHILVRGPNDETSDNRGCFLELAPPSKLVFTSVLTGGRRPHATGLSFTAIIAMSDEGEGTLHRHRNASRRRDQGASRVDGFFHGWNTIIDQIEALANRIA
jgi:uncharacterized protein YndB with AHSA1/START domain